MTTIRVRQISWLGHIQQIIPEGMSRKLLNSEPEGTRIRQCHLIKFKMVSEQNL